MTEAMTCCPDCRGARVDLLAAPTSMDGYEERNCETCKGAGEVSATDAAHWLLAELRRNDRRVLEVKKMLKDARETSFDIFTRLQEVTALIGTSVHSFERANPPAPEPVPEF